MEKKYELIPSDKEGLYRIKALKDFANVKVGDIGGYVSGEHNLSHDNDCWIYNNAIVSGNAQVCNNVNVFGCAKIYDSAIVSDDAKVYGSAIVYGDALVFGEARVSGNAQICGFAQIYGETIVSGNAQICGFAQIYGETIVYGDAQVSGSAIVSGYACIYSGNIQSTYDYMLIGPIGSRAAYTTFFKDADKIMVSCGCFKGTIQEFEVKVKETHQNNKFAQQYLDSIEYVKKMLKFN